MARGITGRLAYSRAQYDHIMAIVMRMDYFRADDKEVLEELRQHYPDFPPNYTVLRNIRDKIRKRNLKDYSVMRKSNDNFIGLVMQKFKNFNVIRNEYLKLFKKDEQTDYMKLKILLELRGLDKDELQMMQDLPYLTEFHSDIRSDLDALNTDIAQNNNNKDDNNGNDNALNDGGNSKQQPEQQQQPELPINGLNNSPDNQEKTTDKSPSRIPIQEISPNKEIQNILSSRDQSGFTRFTKR